jgi:thiamine biosynthesis lipoprotein
VGLRSKADDIISRFRRVRALKTWVGFDALQLNGNKLIKSKPCVRIDLNGIAQGYTVDVLNDFIFHKNIRNYVIELGGELRVYGKKKPDSEPFRIGIETPPGNDLEEVSKLEKVLYIDSGAITTSGNYRKYKESNGRKISHLINPQTGYPVQNELISVTVYADDAITADAYDNALMLMGLDNALHFTEQNKGIAAFFIYKLPSGKVTDTASSRFYHLIKND